MALNRLLRSLLHWNVTRLINVRYLLKISIHTDMLRVTAQMR